VVQITAMAPPLLTQRDIALTFSATPGLTGAGLSVSASDRVCLVGRNGSSESTLLRIAAGCVQPLQQWRCWKTAIFRDGIGVELRGTEAAGRPRQGLSAQNSRVADQGSAPGREQPFVAAAWIGAVCFAIGSLAGRRQ
jgi:energy-coupling factor transporter ATP-binding protein EcfA2